MVAIPEATKKGYAIAKDGDGIYIDRPHQKRGVVQDGMIQTLKTTCNDAAVVVASRGRYVNGKIEQQLEVNDIGCTNTITTVQKDNYLLESRLRIRKLTELECWRLMGIPDEAYYKATKVVSNSQLYKQAGNGIVVDVIGLIIKQLAEE